MTRKELNNLKKKFLNKKLKAALIKNSGFSRRYVNYVLDGKRECDAIIDAAKQILNNN